MLPNVDRIDAALAALTGVLALEGESSFLGDPNEGVILVPVSKLPVTRLLRERTMLSATTKASTNSDATANGPVPEVQPEGDCQCGCGASVQKRFLRGHDAKLRSMLKKAEAAGNNSATQRLDDLGWGDAAGA
jgi:hypothetical protein